MEQFLRQMLPRTSQYTQINQLPTYLNLDDEVGKTALHRHTCTGSGSD